MSGRKKTIVPWLLVALLVVLAAGCGKRGEKTTGPSPEEITKQAIELLREHNTRANGGRSWRWGISPIPIWFDPGISRVDVERAIGLWMGGVPALKFEIVEGPRPQGIEMLHTTIDTFPGVVHCIGAFGCTLRVVRSATVATFATILIDNTRQSRDPAALIAHELGHAVGISGHLTDGSIMANPPGGFLSPALREALQLLYTNPPGTVF